MIDLSREVSSSRSVLPNGTDPVSGGHIKKWKTASLFFLIGILLIGIFAFIPRLETGISSKEFGARLPLWSILPFIALLLCIAGAPLSIPKRWERNGFKARVAFALALPVALFFILGWGQAGLNELLEKSRDYVSFLSLLAALYVIAGGVFMRGSFSGTPNANTAMFGIGSILASFVGTTGASMLLIRPLLRANMSRERKVHIFVFFIFIVSNIGGLLTPLGDPPLFLGFLKGVPFEWTLQKLFLPWLFANGVLLCFFRIMDRLIFIREERRRPGSQLEDILRHEPLRIDGTRNLVLLVGVLAVVFCSGRGLGNGGNTWPFGVSELIMLGLAALSLCITPRAVHAENGFSFAPIAEVAILFAGIFITMAPVLLLLNTKGTALGITKPWQFFWASGGLSSFLDNAPTYLTFSATAGGLKGVVGSGRFLAELLTRDGGPQLLTAVAAGSVMMGANTYIGNGPNFMVKAIVENMGVRMPGFFGYMVYSTCILIPLFIAATFIFFV
jgi:Na+/H+ antiporter NhaD/arsenite permease-like protein